MKKTFRERLKSNVNKWRKKYPRYSGLLQGYFSVMMFFYQIGLHFASNGKRYLCMGIFLLFFAANTSFAFYGSDVAALQIEQESDITLASERKINPEDMEVLEDEDVLDDYIEADFHDDAAAQQFTLDDILEGNDRYLNPSSEEQDGLVQPEEGVIFSAEDWRLVLINKQHPIPDGYTFELETIKEGMQCDERIMEDLLTMLQEAREEGINLAIRSPYRDLSRQVYLFNRKITRYMNSGMSYMDAYKTASQSVTVPGASEHQIGLALDITSDTYLTLDEGFADTAEGKWLAEHSCEYGFILRYPKGKEYITSIGYEPWHFRYVGVEAATIITESGLTLEEFWNEYVY